MTWQYVSTFVTHDVFHKTPSSVMNFNMFVYGLATTDIPDGLVIVCKILFSK